MKRQKRYCEIENKVVERFTIKEIFQDNWGKFIKSMDDKGTHIRPTILEEVKKMIDCQDPKKGTAMYLCETCNKIKHVPFTCKSRFCNTCGAKYSEDRAFKMSAKLLKGEHRHVVFTIAEELRPYFAHDRTLLDLLFQAVSDTLFFFFASAVNPKTIPRGLFLHYIPSAET